MNFLWTTLQVNDLDASLVFYRDRLGLELDTLFEGEARIAFLGRGETKLELLEGAAKPSPTVSLGFQVEDLAAWRDKLSDYSPSEMISPSPGLTFCFFVDPDGYLVQLVEMGQND
ncbi:MAG TPA: VOC family protein [Tissierellia bacterium]|nr:VOC family protein [Tissierellia bacterium]